MNLRLMVLGLWLMNSVIACAMDRAIIVYRGTPSEQVRQKVEDSQFKKDMHKHLITNGADFNIDQEALRKHKNHVIDVVMGEALSKKVEPEVLLALVRSLEQQGISLKEIQSRIIQLREYTEHVHTFGEQTYRFAPPYSKNN